MAVSRLTSTEKNLKKNPEVAAEYQKTIVAYVSKGISEKFTWRTKMPPQCGTYPISRLWE